MDTIVTPEAVAEPSAELPPGEYAIIEIYGHTTLVGRISEVRRFGTDMLAVEPLFAGKLLPAVYQGGASIYRLTPCSAEVAWKRQPSQPYQLPPAVLAIVPPEALPAPVAATERADGGHDPDDDPPF